MVFQGRKPHLGAPTRLRRDPVFMGEAQEETSGKEINPSPEVARSEVLCITRSWLGLLAFHHQVPAVAVLHQGENQ